MLAYQSLAGRHVVSNTDSKDLSLNNLWHCLSLGLERKLAFSSLVATAEFSKFAGILSAALSQHHLLGFEIAQLIALKRREAKSKGEKER